MKNFPVVSGNGEKRSEDMGLLLFDADNDGDVDLYCTSGSDEFPVTPRSQEQPVHSLA